ncbi:MAG: ATP synthase F1 subunit delta [Robiginitomaculum sp.]|nr:ATP synthase F1 subunit delta [Robiginitomaculum sp.]
MAKAQIKSANAAGRYGVAIFDLAKEAKRLAAVEKELLSLKKLLQSSAALREAMASPVIAISEKSEIMQALAKKAKWSILVSNFLAIACDNGRAAEITDMVDSYMELLAQEKNSLSASAITAQELTTKQKTNLAASLKKALGSNVKLETEVDPRLLGGLVVQVGSVMFDSSLKTQLEGLKLAMKES